MAPTRPELIKSDTELSSAANENHPTSFGSEADLQTAANIAFALLQVLREARKDSAIVVLNFRALQARRIDEMQEQLLELSRRELSLLRELRAWMVSELNDPEEGGKEQELSGKLTPCFTNMVGILD
ncbi:hypothetical protein ACEPPN_019319 [Leptodophora sp. 'Broadleaf-Isolate-01']